MRSQPWTHLVATTLLIGGLGGLAACGSDGDAPKNAESAPASTATNGGEETPATSGPTDVCTLVTDAEIGAVLGSPVTRRDQPGGGCSFDQEDLSAASVALNTSAFTPSNGGYDAALSGVSMVISGKDGAAVDGIGDEAFVKTGTTMGGENQQGGGVVHLGSIIVQVTVLQGRGLSADAVRALVVDTLRLAASKL